MQSGKHEILLIDLFYVFSEPQKGKRKRKIDEVKQAQVDSSFSERWNTLAPSYNEFVVCAIC